MEVKLELDFFGKGKNRKVKFTNPLTGKTTIHTYDEFMANVMPKINALLKDILPLAVSTEIKVSPHGYDSTAEHFKHIPRVKVSKLPAKPAAKRKSPVKKKAEKRKSKDAN